MNRRKFITVVPAAGMASSIAGMNVFSPSIATEKINSREYWIDTMIKIADPILINLSKAELKKNMPVESKPGHETDRKKVTYLEGFARLMCGIAPWLNLGEDSTAEGLQRKKYIDLSILSLSNAVNPTSPDFMNFTEGSQPLVDAAFLAHSILRAPDVLWNRLDQKVKNNLISAFKSTRIITPHYNNWLLFSAMIEAALLKFDGSCDLMRIDYAIKEHLNWYKGDGMYGDGPDFHFDYYNSFVIQPMLLDILKIISEKDIKHTDTYNLVLERAKRYACIQERMISPEGTFPPIGRSLAYRFGAFQHLAQIALMNILPKEIEPSQVRCALTSVIKKMIEAPGTFDANGWLTIGFYGHQPEIGEMYISTGSLYLCSTVFLPLGLKELDPFWSNEDKDWTSKKIWKGIRLNADHAL